jgi:dipeptidyl aminopeptidase/acylaminoacyl peptidase
MLARLTALLRDPVAVTVGVVVVTLAVVGDRAMSGDTALRRLTSITGNVQSHPALWPDIAAAGQMAVVDEVTLWSSDSAGQFHSLATAPTGGYLQDPAWRPDGEAIAYTRYVPRLTNVSDTRGPDWRFTAQIWQVDRQSEAHPLITPDDADTLLSQPAWSPDGNAIFYVRSVFFRQGDIAGQSRRIERRTLSNRYSQPVVEDGYWPTLSADGRLLAYVQSTPDGRADLWVHDLETGGDHRLTDGRFASITSPSFADDGQTIAFGGALVRSGRGLPADRPTGVAARLLDLLATPAYAHELLSGLWTIHSDGTYLRPIGAMALDGPIVRWRDAVQLFLYDEDGLIEADRIRGSRVTIFRPGSYRGFDWLPRPLR